MKNISTNESSFHEQLSYDYLIMKNNTHNVSNVFKK